MTEVLSATHHSASRRRFVSATGRGNSAGKAAAPAKNRRMRIIRPPQQIQPVRSPAIGDLDPDPRLDPRGSRCLRSSIRRADPAMRAERGQRPKARAGAVRSLPCRSIGEKEQRRLSLARKRPRGQPNSSFRPGVRARRAQSRAGGPLPGH